MRRDIQLRSPVAPLPVLVVGTYDEKGAPNAMVCAWGGVYDGSRIILCISKRHKTTENVERGKVFTVMPADFAHVKEVDYIGVVSGYDAPEKLRKAGFHAHKGHVVDAPVIDELPIAVECDLESLADIDGRMVRLIGLVRNVSVDERVLDAEGNVDIDKADLVAFDSFRKKYHRIGKAFADAYTIGKELI